MARQLFNMDMNIRKVIRDMVRATILRESVSTQLYLLEPEDYSIVPDVDRFIEAIKDSGHLAMFFQMQVIGIAVTEAKAEIEKSGLDQYDYPEGIDEVIKGGKSLLVYLEKALINDL